MIRVHEDLLGEMVAVDQVRPHPRNANNGDVEEIVASMQIVGCYRPVYVSRRSNLIVGGHHVFEALVSQGFTQVPVKWVDCRSEEEEVRVLAADNGIARRARMDPGLEMEMLTYLEATEFGLAGTGSDEYDLARLKADLEDPFHATGFGGEQGEMDFGHTCSECGGVCHGG